MKSPRYHISNSRVRSARSSATNNAHKSVNGITGTELTREFVQAKGRSSRRSEILNKLIDSQQIKKMRDVGAMCIEMARDDYRNAEMWLQRADEILCRSINSFALSGLQRATEMHKSKRLLSSMPHYYSVLTQGKLPGSSWNTKMAMGVLLGAKETLQTFQRIRQEDKSNPYSHREDILDIIGEMSECAIHGLALRAACDIGPNNWAPAPSYFSQDHAYLFSKSSALESWDLTVQTSLPCNDIDDTYKIQVKTSDIYDGKDYADDITLLRIRPDLNIEGEYNLHPETILEELIAEAQGDTVASSRLSRRQELFLNILG